MPKTTGLRDREKYLVARLAKKIPSIGSFGKRAVRLGIGDDSAVLRPSSRSEFVISCDFSLEGVHFRDAIHPAVSIGYRCLARATSDIAAMGARPRYFLLALALPVEKTMPASSTARSAAKGPNWLDSFSSGLARAARELGMLLIGGDITVSPSVTVCVTVVGELPTGHAISRSGARPGDLIYVTGTLGAAQLGLQLLLHSASRYSNRPLTTAPSEFEAQFDFRRARPQDVAVALPISSDISRTKTSCGTDSSAVQVKPSFFEALASEGDRASGRGKHAWPPALKKSLEPHLYPRIPIAFAQALARRCIPSAMMDISDGLSTDLARLCESSRVGARLYAVKLPCLSLSEAVLLKFWNCHPERSEGSAFTPQDTNDAPHNTTHCHSEPMRPPSGEGSAFTPQDTNDAPHNTTHCHSEPMRPASSEESAFRFSAPDAGSINLDPLQLALHGGEDYALLFTVPPNRAPLLRAIAAKTNTRITQIGEITRSRKILLIDSSGRASTLEPRGWNPFGEDNRQ